jgi:CubicO group peptidase (beta-lactamase class C family)
MKYPLRRGQTDLPARLESLETRALFAATAALGADGKELAITGSSAADSIVLSLDGRTRQFTLVEAHASPQVIPAAGVRTLRVNLGAGNDNLDFKTVGTVRESLTVIIDGAEGDDTIRLRWADDGSTARGSLTATVKGGDGNDAIGFRVGALAGGATATLQADGDQGNDALAVQSLAAAAKNALRVAFHGGAGDDTLVAYQSGNLTARSRASYDFSGDDGNDSLTLNLAGRLAGAFSGNMDGGSGDDQLSIDATNARGSNALHSMLLGGEGDDEFDVLARSGNTDVTVDGGTGTNTGLLIGRVRATHVQERREPTNYELRTGPLPTFNPVLPTQTIERDGRSIEYFAGGRSDPDKPVVVLLTGFGGDIDYWQSVPGELIKGSQVIAVNRPGYRGTTIATGDYAQTAIDDVRAVVAKVAPGRQVVLVGHSLGGLYANLFARLHPTEVAGVVFVDSTAPQLVTRIDDAGIPFGGLGDPTATELRLEEPGVGQEIEGVVSLARQVLAIDAFPLVPVISLRAGPADLLADDPQGDAWYEALGSIGYRGETRRVPDSGHNVQFDRPNAVISAVRDLLARTNDAADSRFVSDVLAEVAKKNNIPGLSAAVVIGDRVVTGTTGVREVGKPQAVQTDDRFHLGSTTKAMTATLTGVLVEKGVVSWNTTVGDAFPELKDKIDPQYFKATLTQLLSHTAGVINDADVLADPAAYPGLIDIYSGYIGGEPTAVRAAFVPVLLAQKPTNAPGTFHYSNFGYGLAGAMLDRITGQSYESLMQQYVFGPLGMTTASFSNPAPQDDGVARFPVGHNVDDGNPVSQTDSLFQLNAVAVQNPAGSNLAMSAADWASFIRAQLGQRVNGMRLLSSRTVAFLQTTKAIDVDGSQYGLGWYTGEPLVDHGLGSSLYHGGQDGPWWGTEVVAHRDTKFATLIMANRTQDGAAGMPYQALTDSAFAEIRQRLEDHFALKATTLTTLTADVGAGHAGESVKLMATIKGGSAPRGVVTFKNGSQVLGTVSAFNGVATLVTTDLPIGLSKITAVFAGDAGHHPSQSKATVRLTAPSAESQFITGVLADVAKKYGIPGLAAGTIAANRVTTGAAGVRQAGGTDAARAGDRFANGSTTKAMTSTLAGVLVERGLIRWDSTVVQVFPELKGKIRPELESATLEAFLRHRTGLIGGSLEDSSATLLEKAASLAGLSPDAARRELLPTLLNEPLAVKPGEFYYSNAGYAVAAAMLERVTGKAYESLMQQYVFGPLGMTSATFDPSGDVSTGAPLGTDPTTGKPVPFDSTAYQQADPPILNPAGVGLRMNVSDWANFVRLHLGQSVNGVRLLKPETLARLHTPDPRPLQGGLSNFAEGYAAGWGTRAADWNGRNPSLGASLDHDGSDNYWLAEVEAFPKAGFAILVMANTTVDNTGKDIEATAFAEIKERLTARFAPGPARVAAGLRTAVAKAQDDVNLPAVSAGVILKGRIVALETTGVRRNDNPTPASASDSFYLSSNGKAITATVAGLLVERKEIRWDTTIAEAFPDLDAGMNPAYRNVTLEDLLNHRGGFADPVFEDDSLAARMQAFQGTSAAGRAQFLPELLQSPPAGPRGGWVYSNTGYVVAGAMLEKATGESFEQLTDRLIFRPLGITSGLFGVPGVGSQADKELVGHDPNGPVDDAARANFLRLVDPSGGIAMSGPDWAMFLRAHLGQKVNGVRVLSDKLLIKLHTPDPRKLTEDGLTFRNGFGWNTTDTPAGPVLFHGGHVGTWSSFAVLLPARKLGVFAVTNKGGGIDNPDPAVPDRVDALVQSLAQLLTGGTAAQKVRAARA